MFQIPQLTIHPLYRDLSRNRDLESLFHKRTTQVEMMSRAALAEQSDIRVFFLKSVAGFAEREKERKREREKERKREREKERKIHIVSRNRFT